MKVLAVVNPIAGRGCGVRLGRALGVELRRRGWGVEICETQPGDDPCRFVDPRVGGVDHLVVVGGDGTLNAVLNRLADPGRIPLVLLALGTANVVAHELGLPNNPGDIADLLVGGTVRRLDLGIANGRRFLTVASVGFDAMVTKRVKNSRRGALGYRGYARSILRTLYHYTAPRLHVIVDGGAAVRGAMVVIGNTKNYGGLFSITDRARCDSGHLDVCVFPRGGRGALLAYSLAALRGRVSGHTDAVYLTGRSIRVVADRPTEYQVDGDYAGTTPMEVSLLPKAVPMVVPR